jgi:hypothetical protein
VAAVARRGPARLAPSGAFFLALALACLSFSFQGHIGLDLGDEGNLWYGAIHASRGEIPGVDFKAYDPGRYYWAAPWVLALGPGLIALRVAVAAFQVLGLTLGLLAARRVVRSWWGLGLVGLLLLAWMHPRHKLFECSLTMMAVWVAVRLLEAPTIRRCFATGVFVGLAAFMGRNHGVYALLAFGPLLLLVRPADGRHTIAKWLGAWLAGIVIGYAPMLALMAHSPDLLALTMSRVPEAFARRGTTTALALPVPWPWTVDWSLPPLSVAFRLAQGLCFVMLAPAYALMALYAFRAARADAPGRTMLIASVAVGVPYMHHAFGRADLPHLAQSIHPFWLGVVALPVALGVSRRRAMVTRLAMSVALVTLFAVVLPASPYFRALRRPTQFVSRNVAGDRLWIEVSQATYLDGVTQLVARHVGPEEELLIVPFAPGLYPILRRDSPIRETFFILPTPAPAQEDVIRRLRRADVRWVLLVDRAVDGRDDLRFRRAQAVVWRYLTSEFEQVDGAGSPADTQLLRRRDARVGRRVPAGVARAAPPTGGEGAPRGRKGPG